MRWRNKACEAAGRSVSEMAREEFQPVRKTWPKNSETCDCWSVAQSELLPSSVNIPPRTSLVGLYAGGMFLM